VLTYTWIQVDGTEVSLSVAVSGVIEALAGDTTDTITFTAPDVATDTALTVKYIASTPDTTTPAAKTSESPSGGSFGYIILILAGLRFFRK